MSGLGNYQHSIHKKRGTENGKIFYAAKSLNNEISLRHFAKILPRGIAVMEVITEKIE